MALFPLYKHLQGFHWVHEPSSWTLASALTFTTHADTDYWQHTHYGFQRDNGHFFCTTLRTDFSLTAQCTFAPTAQYDQCGLMCRVDATTWIKCSVEYETPTVSRLGSVVTNAGYSDWATQDVPATLTTLHYKLNRRGADFRLMWGTDGQRWQQMRIAHLHRTPVDLQVGVYACSPTGPGCICHVHDLRIAPNDWEAPA